MGPDAAVASHEVGKDRLVEQRGISRFGVLLVGNFLSKTRPGSCTICELLAERLSSAGWTVLTTSNKSSRLLRLTDMLMTTWRRRHEYAVAQVDVYSGPSFIWAEAVCWLLRRLGKPFILTLHGGNLPAFARRRPGRVRRLLNSASAVTTPSRFLQEALRTYRDDLRLLPNAINLAAYQFKLRSNPQPRLVWLRAFHSIYNPCMAIRTLAHLLQVGTDCQAVRTPHTGTSDSTFQLSAFPISAFHLSMFGPDKGDGSYEQVKSDVERLGLEARVNLAGAIPKSGVPEALNSGDIFLNTTNMDNTPVSVIEAMGCGLCVVSTSVGGMPFLVDNEQDGLLVQSDDATAMAAAVRHILTKRGLAERLSRNARTKAEQYDWSAIFPQWERLLAEAASASDDRRTTTGF